MQDIESLKASIALALLNADLDALKGQVPDLLEVDLWRQGKLGEPRAGEVRSYIFNDSDCYAMLLELESAGQHIEQLESAMGEAFVPQAVSPAKASFWTNLIDRVKSKPAWSLGGGFATAAIAVTVFVLVLPALQPVGYQQDINQGYDYWGENLHPASKDWPWGSVTKDKSIDFWGSAGESETSFEKVALSHGIRRGMQQLTGNETQWNNVLEALPEKEPSCQQNEKLCEATIDVAKATGQWAVLVFWQCQASAAPAEFWQEQTKIRTNLLAEAEKLAEPEIKSLLMAKSPGNKQSDLCKVSRNILNWAYSD